MARSSATTDSATTDQQWSSSAVDSMTAPRPPPAERLAAVTQPVLLMTGARVDPHSERLPVDFYGAAADAAAALLPHSGRATVEHVGHVPDPALLGPIVAAFCSDPWKVTSLSASAGG